MLTLLKIVFFSFIIASVLGCASQKAHHHAAHMHHEYTEKIKEAIKPLGMHEDCMELMPNQMLDYSFESSNSLNFNIHYHDDSEIIYLVIADNTFKEHGSFCPEKQQYYCLMWTNPHNEIVNISYTYTARQMQ